MDSVLARPKPCDWCSSPLSAEDQEDSISLGLHDLHSAACGECIAAQRFRTAPPGWIRAGDPWPGTYMEKYWANAETLTSAIRELLVKASFAGPFKLEDVEVELDPLRVRVKFRWGGKSSPLFGFLIDEWALYDSGCGAGLQAVPSNVWLAVTEETDTGVMVRGKREEFAGVTWIVEQPFSSPTAI